MRPRLINDLYEIPDIRRVPHGHVFVSSCRLVTWATESSGKKLGTSGNKIGKVHLRWACAEAAVLFIRQSQPEKEYFAKLEHAHGKAKALTVRAHKLGRAVYDLRTREHAFDLKRFVTTSPLRGELEPLASLAHAGLSLVSTPSVSTAETVPEQLDERPGAAWRDWTLSPAPLLGDASSSALWLPLRRVWYELGVFSDTTRAH